jgi:hypothetical protein
MKGQLEPEHYIRIAVSRELSISEFEDLAGVVDDHVGDYIDEHTVLLHMNKEGMFCYVFSLTKDIIDDNDGSYIGDSLASDIDDIIPDDMHWEIETNIPDFEIDADESTTEAQVFESALAHLRKKILH